MTKNNNKNLNTSGNRTSTKQNKNKNKNKQPTNAGNSNSGNQPKQRSIGNQILSGIGGVGGSILGGLIGMPAVGSAAGSSLGSALSKWIGLGDYSVRSNVLIDQFRTSGSIPSMHKTNQSIIVRHKEYIADISPGSTPTAFNIFATYPLNPGLPNAFPWLSTIAQQFQEYTWRGIIFHFISTSGESVASTNTSLGNVMMATNYRASAPNYQNKVELLNEYFSTDGKISESFCHPVECDPKQNPYNVQYVRTGAVPAGEDIKSYDLGAFSIATEGVQSNVADLGELWVTYEVELRKPIVKGIYQTDADTLHFSCGSTISATNPFGTSQTLQFNSFPTVPTFNNNSITFPKSTIGTFQFTFIFYSVTSCITLTPTVTNCTLTSPRSTPFGPTLASVTSTTAVYTFDVKISDPTVIASISFAWTTFVSTGGADLYVAQENSTLA